MDKMYPDVTPYDKFQDLTRISLPKVWTNYLDMKKSIRGKLRAQMGVKSSLGT